MSHYEVVMIERGRDISPALEQLLIRYRLRIFLFETPGVRVGWTLCWASWANILGSRRKTKSSFDVACIKTTLNQPLTICLFIVLMRDSTPYQIFAYYSPFNPVHTIELCANPQISFDKRYLYTKQLPCHQLNRITRYQKPSQDKTATLPPNQKKERGTHL